MQAIGYIRVSTNKQADKGFSLEAQRERIQAMAVVQQAELLDIVVDAGESAKDLKRPGMERVLAMVATGQVATVIIAKLDRLTRSVRDLADLLELFQRRGVSLVSVAESLDTGSASGRLVLNIMVSVSQWEREAIGERTKTALQFKISQNQWVGNTAYGFRLCADRKTVEADPSEQRIRRTMVRLRDEGRSLRQIAAYLNKAGRFTRRGTPWRHDGVARVLRAA
ncbi:MAG: recombinase family protein [Bryobacterales bacterium]|nr:recombinase family protein [Bryobacterales bacterium]